MRCGIISHCGSHLQIISMCCNEPLDNQPLVRRQWRRRRRP